MITALGDREQMIAKAVMRRPGGVPGNTIVLWDRLAAELTVIVGDVGFQSLYNRSLHKTHVTFPWLGAISQQTIGSQFSGLATSLQTRDPAEAGQASIMLLNTFMSILAKLVGEILTTSIVDAALDVDTRDATSEEPDNE